MLRCSLSNLALLLLWWLYIIKWSMPIDFLKFIGKYFDFPLLTIYLMNYLLCFLLKMKELSNIHTETCTDNHFLSWIMLQIFFEKFLFYFHFLAFLSLLIRMIIFGLLLRLSLIQQWSILWLVVLVIGKELLLL